MEQFKNLTALIADDDVDYNMQLTFELQRMGFKVISTESQKEAEEVIATTKPDIAIFDLMMENRDSGFILSYRMKKRYPDVPIIILSAVTADTGIMFGVNTDEEKAWIKADAYLEKGLRIEQFEMEIKQLLNK